MGILNIILSGIICGVFGALLMNLFLRWISASFDEPVNMVKVIGSYFSGTNEHSLRTGSLLHISFGAAFGVLYCLFLVLLNGATLPLSFFAGLGMGFAHGLLVSYGLMFFIGEKHPISRYRKSTFSVGILYLISHVIYGGSVGLLLGLFHLIP